MRINQNLKRIIKKEEEPYSSTSSACCLKTFAKLGVATSQSSPKPAMSPLIASV